MATVQVFAYLLYQPVRVARKYLTKWLGVYRYNCKLAKASVLGDGKYRLELNPELYEGLRYGWIHAMALDASSPPPTFTVTALYAVCQVLPINYVDHAFEGGGPAVPAGAEPGAGASALNEVWYTAIYTMRVALLKDGVFGSILMDRGDRFSWTGDAHLAQKAALAAFGGDFGAGLVAANTERTKSVDNGIITYDLYFILSAVDYFMHTGDAVRLISWSTLIQSKFGTAAAFWSHPTDQHFDGSDERIGADFERTNEPEQARYYKMLSVKTALAYADAVELCTPCPAAMRTFAMNLRTTFSHHFESKIYPFLVPILVPTNVFALASRCSNLPFVRFFWFRQRAFLQMLLP